MGRDLALSLAWLRAVALGELWPTGREGCGEGEGGLPPASLRSVQLHLLSTRPPPRLSPCCLHLALTLVGIILGTHHEKGAFTFWSYAIGLPLPSSSILSWKFCHVLHKVLRDGHPNVSSHCSGGLGPPSAAS